MARTVWGDASLAGSDGWVGDLDTFRDTFIPPAECLKPNTLTCRSDDIEKWNEKYFSRYG